MPVRDLPDLLCFSHLRWQFVFQRPQHLMVRFARQRRVYFIEEPIADDVSTPTLSLDMHDRVRVVVLRVPREFDEAQRIAAQRAAVDALVAAEAIKNPVLWYYTPLALPFSEHLAAGAIVYDCMDELSGFKGASSLLPELEQRLMARADVVFTGGQSLFEAKQGQHKNIHAMPSSVDVPHFAAARQVAVDPDDQAPIPRPRLGFFGVLDERLDIALVDGVARARPDWQLVMIGPVVKIDPNDLPRRPNLHYLGAKAYADLPRYIAGWNVALLPFARNDATRFISPTKTPEYLAAGRPVVSTSIRDVVRPYAEAGLVTVADTVDDMVCACEAAMREPRTLEQARADAFLRGMSWDQTWSRMAAQIDAVLVGDVPLRSRTASAARGI